jgi:hypothetical protein
LKYSRIPVFAYSRNDFHANTRIREHANTQEVILMDVPRWAVEKAADFMRKGQGNRALDEVRNYDVKTFAQLERWCEFYNIPTWRDQPEQPPTREEEEEEGF